MANSVEGEVLIVSARRGGAAEAVLMAIAGADVRGVGEIPSTDKVARKVVSGWCLDVDDRNDLVAEVHLHCSIVGSAKSSLTLRLVRGAEVGVVLRDVGCMSRNRIFSTSHMVSPQTSAVDYVIPISGKIVQPDKIRSNLRRAVHTITAFLFERRLEGLLTWRNELLEINQKRQARKSEHRRTSWRRRVRQYAGDSFASIG